MSFEQFVFYLFSSVMVISAISMVTVRNPVYAALFLILAFFTSAAIWLLLEAEFLGITLVLVYVGAVMVLFLFVIMMLDINVDPLREGFIKILPIGAAVAVAIAAEMILVLGSKPFQIVDAPKMSDLPNTEALGSILYTEYVYPFEIAAVILVVAIIAAISLTLRDRPERKKQNPSEQVRVESKQRVRLVKVQSGERHSTGGRHD